MGNANKNKEHNLKRERAVGADKVHNNKKKTQSEHTHFYKLLLCRQIFELHNLQIDVSVETSVSITDLMSI